MSSNPDDDIRDLMLEIEEERKRHSRALYGIQRRLHSLIEGEEPEKVSSAKIVRMKVNGRERVIRCKSWS